MVIPFKNQPYPPDPMGGIRMVVHAEGTRWDATFFVDIGGERNREHFRKHENFRVYLLNRKGYKLYEFELRYSDASMKYHRPSDQHETDYYLHVGHASGYLPMVGEYDLDWISLDDAVEKGKASKAADEAAKQEA